MFVWKYKQTVLSQFVPQFAVHKACTSVCSLVSNKSKSRLVGGMAFTTKIIYAQGQMNYGEKHEHDTLVLMLSKTYKFVGHIDWKT